jgi:hypothetical protein
MNKIAILEKLIKLYRSLIELYLTKKNMETLSQIAIRKIGTDASPENLAPQTLACAETVTTLLREYFAQKGVDFPIMTGTYEFGMYMEKHTELFEKVFEPQANDICCCMTGTNSRPDLLPNGHTGIYINDNDIVSNASKTGTLEQNYTRLSWRQLFYYYGGYSINLFRLKI